MARHDKQKNSLLLQDKFFYTLLTITLVLLLVAFYFAFGSESPTVAPSAELTQVDTQNNDDTDDVTSQQMPVTQGEDVQAEAPVEDIPQETDKQATEEGTLPEDLQSESALDFIVPCDGKIIKDYSGTSPVFSETLQDWRTHSGVDISTEAAENVFAVADGTVDSVYTDELMGVTIVIKHVNGIYTVYQGLEENTKVLQRMEVKQGDVIGKTGTTAIEEESEGRHLHFEVIVNGKNVDPNEYVPLSEEQ